MSPRLAVLASVALAACRASAPQTAPPRAEAVFEQVTLRAWQGEALVAVGSAPRVELLPGSQAFTVASPFVQLLGPGATVTADAVTCDAANAQGTRVRLVRASDALSAFAPEASVPLATGVVTASAGVTLARPPPQALGLHAASGTWDDRAGVLSLQRVDSQLPVPPGGP
ncbi:MAG: hypothetical protein K1X89_24680 [Myxococcaceae bacterium]|nr:hypothetical protein [Myxococcaceae bacterium]